jgi:hypothetical protein
MRKENGMLRDVQAKRLIAVTLNERGAMELTPLKNCRPGERKIFFVNHIQKGLITKKTLLLGHFLLEFEKMPNETFLMRPGYTNRLYFPEDRRVIDYSELTAEEKEITRFRIAELMKKYRKASKILNVYQ